MRGDVSKWISFILSDFMKTNSIHSILRNTFPRIYFADNKRWILTPPDIVSISKKTILSFEGDVS